ncbi:MAG: hypothetical protein LBE99_02365 [Puniceicoccales bacterium]|nr:hypothetical protein [Puniceicoccales bacterium]
MEDPNDQVEKVELQKFLIHGTSLGIYFVTTTQGNNYVIKVINLKNFLPGKLDDFRGGQLVYQCLQGNELPPNVRFVLPHYCQIIGEETIFSIEDELPPNSTGRMMLWMPKVPGEPVNKVFVEKINEKKLAIYSRIVGDVASDGIEDGGSQDLTDQVLLWTPKTLGSPDDKIWVKKVDKEKVMVFLQSMAQADMWLYKNGIALGHAFDSGGIRFDFEGDVLTIVNTADLRSINRDTPSFKYNMIGQWHLPNMFMAFPDLLNAAIGFYENPDLKQRVIQSVKHIIADRFDHTVTPDDRYLPLDQIIVLIDQYKGMGLIPDRVGISARLFFSPTVQRGEFVSILITNLSDEDKAALRAMHEREIPKVDAQCGNADPRICEAFRHYLSRVYGYQSDFQRRMFDDTDNSRYISIQGIQYNQITEAERALYASLFPFYSKDKYTRDGWHDKKLVFK